MFKLMDKKILTISCYFFLLNWSYEYQMPIFHGVLFLQQEYVSEYMDDSRLAEIPEVDREGKPITTFDMKDAVEVCTFI